jgi:hypothetical protein
MRLGVAHLLCTLAWIGALLGLIAVAARPPSVRPRFAPPTEFSAERAMDDVRGLTNDTPHPVGSPDHARARAWVEARLRALGVEPTMHVAEVCPVENDDGTCAPGWSPVRVENVIGRIEGREPGPAMMLACHYDSVPAGPGAGDDAAGVATVLEIVRALKSGPPPHHTVIVLIDDGEEVALLGARAFVRDHPWAREVRVVLNFEARGNQGQTAMFETSEKSAWLVDVYGREVARPTASSLIYALYQQLPNDTDLTVFKRAGMLGLNFAFADRVADYHTPNDRADRLDPRSLQHMGDQGLAVTRALVDADLSHRADADGVWFDLFSIILIRYRSWLVAPLAFAALLSAGLAIGWAHRRRVVSLRGVMYGLGASLLAIVVAAIAGLVTSTALLALAGRSTPSLASPMPTWLALVAISVAASSATLLVLSRDVEDAPSTWAGGLVLFALLSTFVARALPGGSYLFTLPVLASSIALAAVATIMRPDRQRPFATWAVVAGGLTVSALLWLPIIRVLLVMVGAMVHPATTVPVAAFVVLCVPLVVSVQGRARWAIPALATAVALVSAGFALRA